MDDAILERLNAFCGTYHVIRDDLRALLKERARLRGALDAWHEWCRKSLDSGHVTSHPGNEIPWGLRDAALAPAPEEGSGDGDRVQLPCLNCGKTHEFALDSNEANGIFNVFCSNGECEDRYAAKQ